MSSGNLRTPAPLSPLAIRAGIRYLISVPETKEESAVGVALVAEVMPDRARPYALSLLQALSTVGNISAAVTSMSLGHLEQSGVLGTVGGWAAWRWMFVVGAVPAILVVLVRRRLREPDRWLEARKDPELRRTMGDYG